MDNFEEHLMAKYPNLFPKDSEGKTTYSSCGVGGNDDWQPVIEALCGSIDSYCKHSYRLIKNKKPWPRIKQFLYSNLGRKVYNVLHSILDPYRGVIPDGVKEKKFYVIKPEWTAFAKTRRRYKIRERMSKFYFSLAPRDACEQIHPRQVIIAQCKNKFGGLRFYIDGGDDKVDGMIALAEKLCELIAQKEIEIKKL